MEAIVMYTSRRGGGGVVKGIHVLRLRIDIQFRRYAADWPGRIPDRLPARCQWIPGHRAGVPALEPGPS